MAKCSSCGKMKCACGGMSRKKKAFGGPASPTTGGVAIAKPQQMPGLIEKMPGRMPAFPGRPGEMGRGGGFGPGPSVSIDPRESNGGFGGVERRLAPMPMNPPGGGVEPRLAPMPMNMKKGGMAKKKKGGMAKKKGGMIGGAGSGVGRAAKSIGRGVARKGTVGKNR